MNALTIGKMSKMAGVTNDTVRFYERCGLIEPAGRSESNYRIYNMEDAVRLRFIKRAKELVFSLNEIKDLLALSEDPNATKAEVKARTEEKAGVEVNAWPFERKYHESNTPDAIGNSDRRGNYFSLRDIDGFVSFG